MDEINEREGQKKKKGDCPVCIPTEHSFGFVKKTDTHTQNYHVVTVSGDEGGEQRKGA